MDFFSEQKRKLYCNFCMYSDKMDMKEVVVAEEYCQQWVEKWKDLKLKSVKA